MFTAGTEPEGPPGGEYDWIPLVPRLPPSGGDGPSSTGGLLNGPSACRSTAIKQTLNERLLAKIINDKQR